MQGSTSVLCVLALVAFIVSPDNGWWVIAGIAGIAVTSWLFWVE